MHRFSALAKKTESSFGISTATLILITSKVIYLVRTCLPYQPQKKSLKVCLNRFGRQTRPKRLSEIRCAMTPSNVAQRSRMITTDCLPANDCSSVEFYQCLHLASTNRNVCFGICRSLATFLFSDEFRMLTCALCLL